MTQDLRDIEDMVSTAGPASARPRMRRNRWIVSKGPRRWRWAVLLANAALMLPASAAPARAPSPMAGPDGGYDYAAVDARHHRLYVARSASVTAYDLDHPAAPRSLGTIAHGHAALPIDSGSALLVTSGDDRSVRFLESDTGREFGRVAVGEKPDGAVIDPAHGRAYVMNAKSGTVSAIDLASRTVVSTTTLKPGLEFPAIAGGTLFVNNEEENEIETVDLTTMMAGGAIALPGCTGPSGLAYDAASDRLVAACDNGHAAIVSVKRRTLDRLLPIGDGPDAVIADAARHRVFIPCGASADLYEISLAGASPHVVGHVRTAVGARTGAIDPSSGLVYLPTADFAAPPPGTKRGAMIAGSFRIVVIGSRGK